MNLHDILLNLFEGVKLNVTKADLSGLSQAPKKSKGVSGSNGEYSMHVLTRERVPEEKPKAHPITKVMSKGKPEIPEISSQQIYDDLMHKFINKLGFKPAKLGKDDVLVKHPEKKGPPTIVRVQSVEGKGVVINSSTHKAMPDYEKFRNKDKK